MSQNKLSEFGLHMVCAAAVCSSSLVAVVSLVAVYQVVQFLSVWWFSDHECCDYSAENTSQSIKDKSNVSATLRLPLSVINNH